MRAMLSFSVHLTMRGVEVVCLNSFSEPLATKVAADQRVVSSVSPPAQVLKRPHMLLVTLLLTNAAAMEVSGFTAAVLEYFV